MPTISISAKAFDAIPSFGLESYLIPRWAPDSDTMGVGMSSGGNSVRNSLAKCH
jgi:hypothetical protein